MGIINSYKVKLNNRKTYSINVERYSSAQEVVQDCRSRKITDSSFDDMSSKHLDFSWEGVHNYDEALELLRTGYQPTVDKLQGALKANRTGTQKRITFENQVHGFAPIVPLAMKGVPNSMINMTMKPIKCKVIDVYYAMNCGSSASANDIIGYGQKLLSAIIELEKQGYRFNLYAVQAYSDYDNADMLCVKVKSSDKLLDLKRMSFPLTHPSFIRVIGFDWYSKCPTARYRSAYGRALHYSLSDKEVDEIAKQVLGDNAVYISAVKVRETGEEHLKEVLISA